MKIQANVSEKKRMRVDLSKFPCIFGIDDI